MKPRNMPEKVTIRRAKAFQRATGQWPEGLEGGYSDIRFRKGAKHRLKTPLKFLGKKDYVEAARPLRPSS